jgi:hypothetical protein
VHLYDGELQAARFCALEEASLDGSRLLAYLPGSILVNKEPPGTAFQPDVCPNRITRSVLTAVYALLQVSQQQPAAQQAGVLLRQGQRGSLLCLRGRRCMHGTVCRIQEWSFFEPQLLDVCRAIWGCL